MRGHALKRCRRRCRSRASPRCPARRAARVTWTAGQYHWIPRRRRRWRCMPAWRPCAMRRRPSGASSRPADAGCACLRNGKHLVSGLHHQGKRWSWSLCGLAYVGSAASDSTLSGSDSAGLGPASHCARAARNSSVFDARVTLLLRDVSPQEQVKQTAAEDSTAVDVSLSDANTNMHTRRSNSRKTRRRRAAIEP